MVMKKREQECPLNTKPEHEPEPEPEPDSDCRLYLPYFRLFYTLRMSRPASLDDVLLSLAVSICDPILVSSGPTTYLFLDHGNIHNNQHGKFSLLTGRPMESRHPLGARVPQVQQQEGLCRHH